MEFLKSHWRKMLLALIVAVVPVLTAMGASKEVIEAAASLVVIITGFMKSALHVDEPPVPPSA